jgi:hypothetical protein
LVEVSRLFIAVEGHGAAGGSNDLRLDKVGQAILLALFVRGFKILERGALVNILRLKAIKLVLSPLHKVVGVEK